MLVQIAWRNIWRNKTRSFVVIGSIVIGLWASIFILAFAWGLYKNNIDESVNRQLSHIQIHHPEFTHQQESKFVIEHSDSILSLLQKDDRVQAASARTITKGMITSPTTATGVTVYGISPAAEEKQIGLNENLIEGDYFESGKSNEIFIGEKLAKKLKIKLRSKVVVTFTDIESNMVSAAFRVGGIYRSRNLSLDEVNVYVQKQSLDNLLGLKPSESNELAILLKNESALDSFNSDVQLMVPHKKVEDWMDLSPELELVIESFHLYTYWKRRT